MERTRHQHAQDAAPKEPLSGLMRDATAAALDRRIDSYRTGMIRTLSAMIAIPSISPVNGGEGEKGVADFLERLVNSWGITGSRYDYEDDSGTMRPNLLFTLGNSGPTIWIVAHTDTVPPGDLNKWRSDPFKAKKVNDRIHGLGALDNGIGVISSIYALRAVHESGMEPRYRMGVVLAADEEVGSDYGAMRLVRGKEFKRGDMFIVPDAGSEKGDLIESVEMGIVWLNIVSEGRQNHASLPHLAANAFSNGARFVIELQELLQKRFPATDPAFEPSFSSFEPTQSMSLVGNTNTIPGKWTASIDCRVLPMYDLDEIVRTAQELAASSRYTNGDFRISVSESAKISSQGTSEDSEIVRILSDAVRSKLGVEPRAVGIGGGTLAGEFRRMGYPAVVWFKGDNRDHVPNEYVRIGELTDTAKVLASLFV